MAASDSNYAKEAESVAAAGERWLGASHHTTGTTAIVLDVDDTTLLTWNYEVFGDWAFNPTTNAQFVNDHRFPAVFGMVGLDAGPRRPPRCWPRWPPIHPADGTVRSWDRRSAWRPARRTGVVTGPRWVMECAGVASSGAPIGLA